MQSVLSGVTSNYNTSSRNNNQSGVVNNGNDYGMSAKSTALGNPKHFR